MTAESLVKAFVTLQEVHLGVYEGASPIDWNNGNVYALQFGKFWYPRRTTARIISGDPYDSNDPTGKFLKIFEFKIAQKQFSRRKLVEATPIEQLEFNKELLKYKLSRENFDEYLFAAGLIL
jgi:hypothetical protein